jgi:ABC-type multidrug transport system fused ATPase/permease subunit
LPLVFVASLILSVFVVEAMADCYGVTQRIIGTVVVTIVAFSWQLSRESDAFQKDLQDFVWPPSKRSAPFLIVLILNFIALVKWTFFRSTETEETKRVREVKKRLLLAQMSQALRWDEKEPEDEDEEEDVKFKNDVAKDKDPKTKRPPAAADLFEMVYDDVEERHVVDFGISPNSDPYMSTFALFKERLAADFEDFVKYTNLARRQASGDDIVAMDHGLDNDQLKRVPEYLDGTKLTDLLTLYEKKIKKAFGKEILDASLLSAAQQCRKDLFKEQRKGMAMLLPALRPVLPMYAFAVCLMIFDASNGTVVFHSMKALLDKVGSGQVTVEELRNTTLQTYMKFVFCVFAHLSSWAFTHKVTADFRLMVRNQVMANIVRQDMKFFDFYPSGILQERLNNDAEQLSSKLFHLPLRLVDSFFRLLSCIIILYRLNPHLFFVVAMPVPLISVACNYIIRFMRTSGQRQRKIGEHLAANTMEVLKEIRTVREFAMEGEEVEKFVASSTYRAEIEQHANAVHHIFLIAPLCCLFEGMRFYCTFLGGRYVADGQLTPGEAVMAAGLAGDMTHILRNFFDVIPEIVSTLQPLGRVCDMLSATPSIEPCPGMESKLKPDYFRGKIEFKNVNFTFPAEPLKQVLFNLSWSIAPGETVGFVGGTGCGKSTSLYLLERWYAPQTGKILLDDRDIADYDVHHLRRHMSVVAQTTCLFSTTIRENIIYGLPRDVRDTITDDQIEVALRKANAWKFVNDFPRKLETYAGERGVKLSGGQKQRLAIARAIIRKPTIVLLDEATSALDSKAEVVVQKALDAMMDEQKHGCCMIVAHRLSTLRSCNRIIVMDKGCVKESGSHEELMKYAVQKDTKGNMVNGWYRDLYETQHGKSEDVATLQAELSGLQKKLKSVRRDNFILKSTSRVRKYSPKFARVLDLNVPDLVPPPLEFIRQRSEERVGSDSENVPPPLDLSRAKTTELW